MKISIIIPVYNAENFLKECLDSVVQQTIEEKEVLCIDDGSSDKSYEILKQYQSRYSYIRVFQQKNKGAGAARNIGLKEASGKYVCFLDADDFYLDSNALKKMVYACENKKLLACASLRKLCQDDSLKDFHLYRDYFEDGKNINGVVLKYEDVQDEYHYQNYIFSMKAIKENEVFFPLYRRYQDAPFFLKLMTIIKEYIVLPVEFYGYRFPEEALSRKETYIADTLKGIRDNIQTAQTNHLHELEKILIGRIGLEYAAGIIKGATAEVLELLHEIQSIAFDSNDYTEFTETQIKSFDNVLSLVAIILNGGSIGDFFEKKGITNVAIYGLGNYGKIAIHEVKKSKTITIYGIDQKMKEMPGIEVGTLEEINKKCNDIIITPADGNESIVSDIKNIWNGNVWGLNPLLQEVKHMYHITIDKV